MSNINFTMGKKNYAALLSMAIPGAGQIYNQEILKGLLFFLTFFILPYLLLLSINYVLGETLFRIYGGGVFLTSLVTTWLLGIHDAYTTAERKMRLLICESKNVMQTT